MQILESVNQHGSILLTHNVTPDLNNIVRSYAQEEAVEGCVMQLAKRHTVGNCRFAAHISVRNDMCRIQQLCMFEFAECALLVVGSQNSFPECCLMKALPNSRCYISASLDIRFSNCDFSSCIEIHESRFVDCNFESESCWISPDDENRALDLILSGQDPMKIDQWRT